MSGKNPRRGVNPVWENGKQLMEMKEGRLDKRRPFLCACAAYKVLEGADCPWA